MPRTPKLFTFTLTPSEIAEMEAPSGQGGHQGLHAHIRTKLAEGPKLTFDDCELGELIRYMTQYESGGFQTRLHRAFIRSVCEQIGATPL